MIDRHVAMEKKKRVRNPLDENLFCGAEQAQSTRGGASVVYGMYDETV